MGTIYQVTTAGSIVQSWDAPRASFNDGTFIPDTTVVPIPGAFLLGTLGLTMATCLRRRMSR